MQIHALSTGSARFKDALRSARSGPMRQPALFVPAPFSEPQPIHVWVIEHEGRRILVDTGETASGHDSPFAKFTVRADEELPGALASIGLSSGDLDTVIVTHLHNDHMDGAVHLGDLPVLVQDAELDYSRTAASRVFQRAFRQPVPASVRWQPLAVDAGPFGAFAASVPLSDDGRVRVVSTPGHTPGHVSVVCIDDEGHHVLLAGDVTFTLEQLYARRPDAIAPKPKVHAETLDRVLAHARDHPLVYLPSHDAESAARLAARETVAPS